ncbi:MAG: ATP-dependent DNA helicase RecG [Candidatus Neomarinimicrobiota bacterium]
MESNLHPLDTPVQYVKGVGPRRSEVLAKEGIETVSELLYHFPRRHLDRTTVTAISDLRKNDVATVVGKVETSGIRRARRKYFQLVVSDASGLLNCVWFNGIKYVQKAFSAGDRVAFHGKVDFYNGYQIVHPEYDKLSDEESDPLHTGAVIPLYPSTQALKDVGLDSRGFRRIMKGALQFLEDTPVEFLPQLVTRNSDLIPLAEALKLIHFAPGPDQLGAAVFRLKFDEHFFLQLLMALRKVGLTEAKGRALGKIGPYVKLLYDRLDFELTGAQKRVLKEIRKDLASPDVMNRLLQGDVGSGKTIVAVLASAIAVGNNVQVAIMAPTEVLAHQHYRVFRNYLDGVRITTALLVGKQASKERGKILKGIENGNVHVAVGTHALIQEDVRFHDLGFVIIDEQQRFGVVQRGALLEKGLNPDVLVMTATPIPRTLAITYHGDMDISLLDEMPRNRKSNITRVVTEDMLPKVYDFIGKQLDEGRQCIVIFPVIEGSEKSDLKAAEDGFEHLSKEVFSGRPVALLHGRMKKEEKDSTMDAFANNEIGILIATTVVEVGIDVPNATVMLVENAERFGLTQLHQLRGRVGRGEKKGYCILVQRTFTEASRRRMEIILNTNNGFEISDEDLKLRGPGEFYGTRQHGYPRWKIADLVNDGPIIRRARKAAFDLASEDPQLRNPEHKEIRKRFIRDYQPMLDFVNIG